MRSSFSLSVCICTSGRPVELDRCLASIAAGTLRPFEVIVSDDSCDSSSTMVVREVCKKYDFTRYVDGPRRGLCANRNHVIQHAQGTHVSLLDDDAVIGADFVKYAEVAVSKNPSAIVTGDVLEDGVRLVVPTNPTFLGHFGRPVRPGVPLRNINLNCNVFPLVAFSSTSFDESIVYGYEDTDLCAQLRSLKFTIVHAPELLNKHLPPRKSATESRERMWQAERARFYTTLRRHLLWQRSLWQAAAFLAIAPFHLFLHAMRLRRFDRLASGWLWVARDVFSTVR
jgi:glycosyltransferase involved in cell wall biosynthesis